MPTTAARVFRLGDYPEVGLLRQGFAITAEEFAAANPPGTSAPLRSSRFSDEPIFGDDLSGSADSFVVAGDEVHCLLHHGEWLGAILGRSGVGLGIVFHGPTGKVVGVEVTMRPLIRDARAIPMGRYGVPPEDRDGIAVAHATHAGPETAPPLTWEEYNR